MALNDITLSSSVRQNLISMQLVDTLMSRTSQRLATGKRVNSPVDDPQAFFAAQNHLSRAADLSARKDAMGEAIQAAETATQGIKALTSLIEQAKGLLASARSADTAERADLAAQFDAIRTQIDELAGDSTYQIGRAHV